MPTSDMASLMTYSQFIQTIKIIFVTDDAEKWNFVNAKSGQSFPNFILRWKE